VSGELLSIGRFAGIARLSVKTLRYYDAVGLLTPAYVDPATGRRYYRVSQAVDAERIRLLRGVDLPVADVQRLLAGIDEETARVILERHRDRLRQTLDVVEGRALLVSRLLEREDPLPRYDVRLHHRPAYVGVGIEISTTADGLDRAIHSGARMLFRHVRARGDLPAGPLEAWWTRDDVHEDRYDIRLVFPTHRSIAGDQDVQPVTSAPHEAAVTLHVGPYELMPRAWETMASWIAELAEWVPAAGPREVFLVGPDRAAASDLRTEVSWPLRRASRSSV
jgi:DNA-binding transcriptional MerR regulator